ncbi:MAG: amidase family protein, partial [Candidatus Omnitrophica bacterium]|nr:amidase family protein [Candidatus Omnitrophota bacterium]
MELNQLTAHELLDKLKNQQAALGSILDALYARIQAVEPKVKAYARFKPNDNPGLKPPRAGGFLGGLPVTIKDNICTEGLNTECCSKILCNFRPPYDATVINKLKTSGGGIFPLKANMDEFAFGSSTENSCFGPTHNPWNLECVPGGSSGGSAAAVAGDEAIWALGSDTGGSIRQPASFCGVVGLKPTYGRVSRFGFIAFASSLDQIGPITKDVEDAAILTRIISGYDPNDSTSVNQSVPDYTDSLGKDIKGVKIGIPREYFIEGMDAEVKHIIEEAINKLKSLGAVPGQVALPHTQYAVPVYYIVATA